ncbi:alpha-amlyase [Alteromonas sediminis]|uniref:Alpha-amlyase n=1 Tax=Alteromonas sediminis TaxID=2259342 RepID=A0A3N5XXC4_9ALTE|nr:alpha-amylase family glycosyl hydrolase [Alteromonas sediminis]RPJ65073.1 alpha-amlyase [Alteromonas sediminis]
MPLYNLQQPDWSKNAVIYQVNTRQFSKQGTLEQVTSKLENIKALGIDIVWLMPLHPIGEVNRKGQLGSPYSVKDFLAINPELGDAEQLKKLVAKAHSLSLKIIIDWVPNHSAWDCPLTASHPQWYAKDLQGNFRPSPWWDWSDIIEFDYSQEGLRDYMLNAMAYWVKTFDIDGFRCDVAGYVPNDFWRQVRASLDEIKPVFLLAEWESRDMHRDGFNMTYAWSWNETLHAIAKGEASLDKLRKYYSWNERAWPASAYRMTFVSNHDKNAWDGTQFEQFGELVDACIVLSVLGEGVPLIYNSQECGEPKRLAFFERDPIAWTPHYIGDLYKQLIAIKKQYSALFNGNFGATMHQVDNNHPDKVFSFIRQNDAHQVLICLNLSHEKIQVALSGFLVQGYRYAELAAKCDSADNALSFVLPAGGYRVQLASLGQYRND